MVALVVSCSASSTGKKQGADDRAFTILVTAEMRGQIEPCGCNSNPLGDIARTTEIATSLRAQGTPVLVLDAGSLLYTSSQVTDAMKAQETLRSKLIVDIYRNELAVAGIGLGPYDFGMGIDAIGPARQAANVDPKSGVPIEAPKIVDVGGVPVGVFGVVAPSALSSVGVQASDPIAAAKGAVSDLRARGARLVVGLLHMIDADARRLAKSVPGIDVVVVGQNAPEPDQIKRAPAQVGGAFVVGPANRGQIITRLDVTLRDGEGVLIDALGEARAAVEIDKLSASIAELETQLKAWGEDASADPAFVAGKQRELETSREELAALRESPLRIPDKGSYLTVTQVDIHKGLPCHEQVQQAKKDFDKAAGKANIQAAAGTKPPAPKPGQAGYVGMQECAECHEEAVAFWQKTNHQKAWETLEAVGKQFDYDCIDCHVTGWNQPGGANLAVNEHLRDVQCEVCHGPGSRHIAEEGDTDHIQLTPPETLCKKCHNKEHSDTFEYKAYLRDVTGEDHGSDFRDSLGPGVTGHELRSAALKKAGANIGAKCIK